jgi:dTDP-4-amino-4,6-dideoxygalactose transaminase
MTNKLAAFGGSPVRQKPFAKLRNVGPEERAAAMKVLDDDLLSGFLGTWSDKFLGGPYVRSFEDAWQRDFDVAYAVSVNSASSGLQAAVHAAGVGPGDEVIVTPYSMIISATCVFATGAIPVFADIDPDTFCISADTIRRVITPRTRAIIVVQLYGNCADMDPIMALAAEYNLMVIEDAAQAPGGLYNGRKTGTVGHMGVFSLNVHKTISTGEGGVVVTNDPDLADRVRLVRNHAEVVVGDKGVENIVNMVGYNFRLSEIASALGEAQLAKLEELTRPRIAAADYLTRNLARFPGITPPKVAAGVRHVYYMYALRYDERATGVSRARFVEALGAEGIPMVAGYVRPIYWEPLFQRKIVFGDKGFPFSSSDYGTVSPSYERGLCPVVERIQEREVILTQICRAGVSEEDMADVVAAFEKIFDNIEALKDL